MLTNGFLGVQTSLKLAEKSEVVSFRSTLWLVLLPFPMQYLLSMRARTLNVSACVYYEQSSSILLYSIGCNTVF